MGSRAADKASKTDLASASDETQDPKATSKTDTKARKTSKSSTRKRVEAASKSEKAAILKADLDALEKRLHQADTVTRNSVESLETVVTALQASLKNATSSQKGQLTRQVNILTKRLDDQTAQTRAIVRNELKAALSEGGMDRFANAIDKASARLDSAEIAQADAVAKLNKHLADMARAVDARFNAETRARKSELDTVTRHLSEAIRTSRQEVDARVQKVEHDSAKALHKVGETIELVHNTLEKRRQSSSDDVTEKVNELALQTQADLEAYQAKLEARFEEVEARHLAVGTGAAERVVEKAAEDFDYKITGLQKRLDDLEKLERFTAQSSPPTPQSLPTAPPLPGGGPGNTGTLPPNPIQVLRDRLVATDPKPTPNPTPGPFAFAADNNPYASALSEPQARVAGSGALAAPERAPHVPVEFNPEETQLPSPVLPFPQSAEQPRREPAQAPPLPPFQPPHAFQPELPPLPAADGFEPAPLPDAVYANPAYAEDSDSDSPLAVRVADDGTRKTRKTPLTQRLPLTGRNLRVALLATGVAVVALMAGRMILGSEDRPDPSVISGGPAAGEIESYESGAIEITPTAEQVAEPIGDYVENEPILIDPAQLDTLDAAVEAGNPIAQFQMGLAKLDAGETEAGATLIQQAASSNQPAALYRLAKLYEAGQGVPRDDVMARQLIERAARGGNRIAMHDLALYFTEGRGGVPMDMQSAKSWFEQAARRGVVDSQFNLAVLSESTEVGGTPDQAEALFWYSIAANQGDQFAVTRRDTLRENMTDEQLSQIETRVAAFEPRPIDETANGIFSNVPWASRTQTAENDQVRQVQTLLTSLGYSVGPADGLMGARTRTAIREFERSNGLSETGRVSSDLIQRLANAAGV